MPRIPDLPGAPVPQRSEYDTWLKQSVARLCGLDNPTRFPGSQPVSFGTKDLEKLESQDFWVCEKSDGVRVLLLILTNLESGSQDVFIIDRHNTYRRLNGFFFPHWDKPQKPLRSSLLDGELVIDVDPRTGLEKLRFLAFDCLIVDEQNVMNRTLDRRYGRLMEWFYTPYSKMMKEFPHVAESQPFEILVKKVNPSYRVDDVFNIDMPALQHGSDGLIYTCVNTFYSPGTDSNILKWKPPSENSIDFKLVLRFPAIRTKPKEPDYFAKPIFELHVWTGDRAGIPQYEMYDVMRVEDDEWEKLKTSGQQLDDRIVEVHWDVQNECWRMMRFRDDKPAGNHKSVVENILKSIADGVEKETLLSKSTAIRNAWKIRQGQPTSQPQPPPPPPPNRTQSSSHLQPLPGPQQQSQPLPPRPTSAPRPPPIPSLPDAKPRYGPIATSPWSKVAGPTTVGGMYR
ncbi:mRNA-capping enzyme subunit alpha [Abortiporus biennis]